MRLPKNLVEFTPLANSVVDIDARVSVELNLQVVDVTWHGITCTQQRHL